MPIWWSSTCGASGRNPAATCDHAGAGNPTRINSSLAVDAATIGEWETGDIPEHVGWWCCNQLAECSPEGGVMVGAHPQNVIGPSDGVRIRPGKDGGEYICCSTIVQNVKSSDWRNVPGSNERCCAGENLA